MYELIYEGAISEGYDEEQATEIALYESSALTRVPSDLEG